MPDSKKLIDNQALLGPMYTVPRTWTTSAIPPREWPESAPKPQTEGEALRDEGMARAASSRKALLLRAQRIAVCIAQGRTDRTCASDDVQEALVAVGVDPSELGNAAGSVFRGKEWELVTTRKSRRTLAHARRIGVWRLR